MGNEIQKAQEWGLDELERAAMVVVKSGLFPAKQKEQAMVLMLQAQADGSHPMKAMQEYHIINGRPALRADAMLARFQAAGGKVEWHTLIETEASATFTHPQGGSVTITWTLEMAKKAGLVKPNSGWTKFPRAMLRSRVVSEGVRTVYPGIVTGVYTPEEVMDFDEPVKVEAKTVGPVERPRKATRKKEAASGSSEKQDGAQAASRAAAGALKVMAEKLKAIGVDTPELMLAFSRIFTGREIESAKDLTKSEAAGITNKAKAIADGLKAAGIESFELAKTVVIAYLEKGELPPTEGPYGEADVVDAAFKELAEEE